MTTTSPRPRWWLARQALAVTVLSVAGCGQDAKEAPPDQEMDRVVGQAPAAVDGVPSVILFEPAGVKVGTPTREPVVMDQVGMAFDPLVLVVPPGQTVTFRNRPCVEQ